LISLYPLLFFPLIFSEKMGFAGTLSFQQMGKHRVSEGTVPVPRTAPALCDGVVLPYPESSFQRGCHSGGAEALRAADLKEASEKNSVGISTKPEDASFRSCPV